jgi:peptidoglycan/xylan/chitin deacetylase (PgdA/CDA1 family)
MDRRSRPPGRRLPVIALAGLVVGVLTACQHGTGAAAPTGVTPSGSTSATSSAPVTARSSPPPASAPASTTAGSASAGPSSALSSSSPTSSVTFVAPTVAPSGVVATYAGKDITKLPTTQHVIALTFDAGANADAIPEILATLKSEGVPGTFFLTGVWVQHFPAQAAQIGALYPVGSHSLTHPYFTKLSDGEVAAQLTGAQQAIEAAAGRNPQPLFRFPYGDRDTRTRNLVNGMGYVSVFWTVDTLGWEGTSGGQSVASVTHRVLANLQPGEIVLMHVGSHPTDHSTLDGDALKGVIEQVKAAGYGFVTIPQGLGLPAGTG